MRGVRKPSAGPGGAVPPPPRRPLGFGLLGSCFATVGGDLPASAVVGALSSDSDSAAPLLFSGQILAGASLLPVGGYLLFAEFAFQQAAWGRGSRGRGRRGCPQATQVCRASCCLLPGDATLVLLRPATAVGSSCVPVALCDQVPPRDVGKASVRLEPLAAAHGDRAGGGKGTSASCGFQPSPHSCRGSGFYS